MNRTKTISATTDTKRDLRDLAIVTGLLLTAYAVADATFRTLLALGLHA